MKVYALPDACPAPEPDYRNYDAVKELAAEAKHTADLKAHLIKMGYKGKHTGRVVRFGVADGYALYMIADGPKSCLIHLPYGDGYHYRDVAFLPKKEIIRRMEANAAFDAIFSGED